LPPGFSRLENLFLAARTLRLALVRAASKFAVDRGEEAMVEAGVGTRLFKLGVEHLLSAVIVLQCLCHGVTRASG